MFWVFKASVTMETLQIILTERQPAPWDASSYLGSRWNKNTVIFFLWPVCSSARGNSGPKRETYKDTKVTIYVLLFLSVFDHLGLKPTASNLSTRVTRIYGQPMFGKLLVT